MARQIIKHNLSNIRGRGGDQPSSLVGDAVSEIGYGLSNLDFPKVGDAEENKTAPHGLKELQEAVKPPVLETSFTGLEGQTSWDGLGVGMSLKPRPAASIQNPPAAGGNKNPYGTLVEGPENAPWLENQYSFPSALPGFPAQQPPGPIDTGEPVSAGTRGRTRRKAEQMHGRSPIKRDISFEVENPTSIQGGSLNARGAISGAFAAGYNPVVERHNYKKQVWEQKAREADEEMGKLQVEPSGVTAWDASVENMAREWKADLGELLSNKDQYDPIEYTNKKQEILGRSKQFNQASQQLQQVVADYNENLDSISASTDPEVLDILNTLNKGGGDIQVGNVKGIPTLSGTTIGGKDVSIPISEIASGRNSFRFNTQADIQPQMNQIVGGLTKLKRDYETRNGAVISGPLAWQQLQSQAEPQVDAMLKNNASVRSILADQFGYDYDDYTSMFGQDGDKARAYAKDMLMEQLQQQFQPVQQTQTIKRGSRASSAQRTSPVDVRSQADAKVILSEVDKIGNSLSIDSLQSFKGLGNILDVAQAEDGSYGVKVGRDWYELSTDPATAKRQLAQYAGVDPRNIPQDSPTKRSPLRRLTDWMTSPFKRDKNPFKQKAINEENPFDPFNGGNPFETADDRLYRIYEQGAPSIDHSIKDAYEYVTGKLNPWDRLVGDDAKVVQDEKDYAKYKRQRELQKKRYKNLTKSEKRELDYIRIERGDVEDPRYSY